jgi:hypothetical protein
LPFLNPLLYPLLGTNCFREIISGSNGAYHAGTGYDMVTGLVCRTGSKLVNNWLIRRGDDRLRMTLRLASADRQLSYSPSIVVRCNKRRSP